MSQHKRPQTGRPPSHKGSKSGHVKQQKHEVQSIVHGHPLHSKIHAIIQSIGERCISKSESKVLSSPSGSVAPSSTGLKTVSSQDDDGPILVSIDRLTGKPTTLAKPDTKEQVLVSPQRMFTGERDFARTLLGNRPVFTKLIQDFGPLNGGAGTAFAQSLPQDLTLATGYSNWFNLFDEVRVSETISRFIVAGFATASADTATLMWAANFDPTQAAAPGSIASVLTAARTCGPVPHHGFTGSSLAINNISQGLVPVNRQGHWQLSSGKLTQGLLPPSSGGVLSPSPVGGDWVSTSSAALVVGYFKLYCEAYGGTNSWASRVFIEYTCEFRFRG